MLKRPRNREFTLSHTAWAYSNVLRDENVATSDGAGLKTGSSVVKSATITLPYAAFFDSR